ncbi:hypothetical protein [Niastella populi]|uniref:Uncharacterized protein n=1 Tax=Niastella populi TaxID=550983 RepID=A0A1V9GAA7_9BACT|nr:hypothetical protein [Niastella populi]OQP67490.1 hypothetical protein A4R26_33375 [Niastella populi]
MTLDSTRQTETLPTPEFSKKKLTELVYLKITSSLSEFNLSGKKFESKVKKVSKSFAKDIARSYKKEKL